MSQTLQRILDVFIRPGQVLLEVAGPDETAVSYIMVVALISLMIWLTVFVFLRRFILKILGGRP